MSTRLRLLGVVLLVGGACLGTEAYRNLSTSGSTAATLGEATQTTDRPIDAIHWARRWRSTSSSFLLLAVGVSLTGLALFGRFRWAWGVLAATLVMHTIWLIIQRLHRPPHYIWEATWAQIIATGCAAATCCWAAWRAVCPKRSCNDTDANLGC
jgi:hypothetical protein